MNDAFPKQNEQLFQQLREFKIISSIYPKNALKQKQQQKQST
jgi:hypothetical protein